MSSEITIREGTTNPIQMTLFADNVPIALNSGIVVELKMLDSKGKVYDYRSDAASAYAVIVNTSGTVKFTAPDETIFSQVRQPYELYWWIYTDPNTRYSVPEKDNAVIKVVKDF